MFLSSGEHVLTTGGKKVLPAYCHFKGRWIGKQYMPAKPTKRGVKIWERCDSQSGYVHDFRDQIRKKET